MSTHKCTRTPGRVHACTHHRLYSCEHMLPYAPGMRMCGNTPSRPPHAHTQTPADTCAHTDGYAQTSGTGQGSLLRPPGARQQRLGFPAASPLLIPWPPLLSLLPARNDSCQQNVSFNNSGGIPRFLLGVTADGGGASCADSESTTLLSNSSSLASVLPTWCLMSKVR